MWNAGLDEAQAGIKISRRNSNNLRYADDTTLIAESEKELKSLLMKVKEESEKAGLKTQHSKSEDYGIWFHHFMANRWGNTGNSERLYFGGLQNHCKWWPQPWNKKMLAAWKKSYDKPRQCIKKQRHYFANKVHLVKAMVSPVVMYGREIWTIKKAEQRWIDAFELWRFESPLDCKEIHPVHPKGNQPWVFIGRTDAEAETPIIWPPDVKSLVSIKDPDAEKDWGQEEKGTTEDERVGWHHRLSGYEFEQALGDGERQGNLASMWSQRIGHDWTTKQQQQKTQAFVQVKYNKTK